MGTPSTGHPRTFPDPVFFLLSLLLPPRHGLLNHVFISPLTRPIRHSLNLICTNKAGVYTHQANTLGETRVSQTLIPYSPKPHLYF